MLKSRVLGLSEGGVVGWHLFQQGLDEGLQHGDLHRLTSESEVEMVAESITALSVRKVVEKVLK